MRRCLRSVVENPLPLSRRVCVPAAQRLASTKAENAASESSLSVGNVVCGVALVGTLGGAANFLLDFPEPCKLALSAAEQAANW